MTAPPPQNHVQPAPAAVPFDFESDGDTCVGDLYLPTGSGPYPTVILASGLGGTRSMQLGAFAQQFAAHGFAAVTFDYRYFGDSSGTPRQLIDIRAQRQDWNAAITAAQSHPALDPARIALWGTSFAGGHVLTVAASRSDIAAVIAQGPFTDGIASARTIGLRSTIRVAARALADTISSSIGRSPVYVESFGPPGSATLMTAPDAMPGVQRLLQTSPTRVDTRAAARIGLHIAFDRPGKNLAKINAPTLIQVCRDDTVAPSTPTLRHIRTAGNPAITTEVLPYGHFDIYFDQPFIDVIKQQITHLTTWLT